jgi:methionine-rich copper-binding protein CopC
MSISRRALTLALTVAAVFGVASAPASLEAARRHVHLKKSTPADKEALVASPKSISLWFSEKVDLKLTTLKLADAKGVAATLGALKRDTTAEAPVVADLTAPIAPGSYTLSWSVAGADGHPQKGSVKFTVKAAH